MVAPAQCLPSCEHNLRPNLGEEICRQEDKCILGGRLHCRCRHYFLDALRGSTTKRLLRGEQSAVLAVRAKRTEDFMEKYDRPRDDELRTHYREHVIWIFVRKSKDQRWEFMTQVIWNEDSDAQAEWFTSALAVTRRNKQYTEACC